MHAEHKKSPTEIATTFDLDDPGERFMLETIHRFHVEPPRVYKLHAIRRTMVHVEGKERRQVHTLTSFHPRTKGGSPSSWQVITFDIDDVSIRFHPCADDAAARERFLAI